MDVAGQPLEGLRILDAATFIAAPFCATLLSEFGADVVKIEEPGIGDSLRHLAEQDAGEGLWWLQEARNKRTITCNLRDPEGQELFRKMAREADVVVENFRPGTMDGWGLGYDELSRENPGLIMLRISGYGQTGPYARKPGFGRIAQAFGGLTYLAGFPDRPPVVPGSATIADYAAGLFGAYAVLIAKIHRDKTGEGQQIDISLFESIYRMLDTLGIVYDRLGIIRERSAFDAPHAAPHSHYPTLDGKWIAIACSNDKIFARMTVAMGRPDLLDDQRFLNQELRVAHRSEIDAIVQEFTSSLDIGPLQVLLDKHEVPASPINSIVDIFADEHFRERGTIVDMPDGRGGTLGMPGIVPVLSKTPGQINHVGRRLGEDNEAVYNELLGLSKADLDELRARGVV